MVRVGQTETQLTGQRGEARVPQDERSHAPPGGRLALALPALLAACVAAGALAAPPSGGSWATIAGYYPGMGKEAARKVGLANCKAAYEAVECKALAALTFAGAVSINSDITLNEKTGRIEVVEFRFSRAIDAFNSK
ncbi:hypothetical protein [Xanthomonas oryzae]|uniref:hypothetical protein n=1 Tax=Xanthomonas oryzae TaxID=347 RepID=UPI00094A0943|nr:hypothetical protein [Xanthomonas oryzae]